MSKPLRHDNDLIAKVEGIHKGRKRWPHGHSLCNQPPAAPTGVSITWDRVEQQRHGVTRGIIACDEVTADVDGFVMNPKNIGHYVFAFQKSDDGSTPDSHTRRFVVEAKDGDSDTTAEKIVHNIHKKYFYRARARCVDTEGHRGPWSSWTSWQHPNPSNNAAIPTNVAKIEAAQRVGLKWDPPGDFDASNNLPDLSVSHYQVQINTSTGFGSGTMKRDAKHVVNDQYRYVVPEADDGVTHYLRVRSVSHDGDVSAWQPADTGIAANNTDVGGVAHLPAGTIIHHATAAPTTWAAAHGYLYCDGASYPTATYVDLFAEIGYTYGGSGANFNVPNSKGRHLVGVSSVFALGANDGDSEANRVATHDHPTNATGATPDDNDVFTTPGTDSTSQTPGSDSTGTTPGSDATGEAGHTHAAGGLSTGNPLGGSSATVGGGNAAGSGHNHDITGFTTGGGSSHGHSHTHGGHGHGHTHGGHGHGHTHGNHGHNHGHGSHGHGHQHGNHQRPHLAQHVFIKT